MDVLFSKSFTNVVILLLPMLVKLPVRAKSNYLHESVQLLL